MGIRKLGLILVAAVFAVATVGSVSAQSGNSPQQPNQQWQGRNDPNGCQNNNQGNNNQWNNNQWNNNNNCGPNGWQNNGRGNQNNNNNGDPNGWQHNGNGDPNGHGRGNFDPRDPRFDNRNHNFFFNPFPPQPIVTAPVVTTTIDTITQEAVLRHIVQIVADSLNLQSSDVTTQMTGTTLAAVIQAHGGNVTALQTQIVTGLTNWLNEIVADGLITQASANTVLDDITNIVNRALNGQFTQTGTTVTGLIL